MKKNHILYIISTVVWLALLGAELLLGHQILKLNMLPDNYLAVLIGVLALIAVGIGLLLRQKKQAKDHAAQKQGYVRQIIGFLLSALVIAGCLIASRAISQVNRTISKVTATPTVSDIVNIYVLAEDPAQSIEDTADYAYAVTDSYDWENTQAAIGAIEDQLSRDLEVSVYDSVFSMIDALYTEQSEALILNSAYISILEEIDGYTDFTSRTRILYEYAIEVPSPAEDSSEPPASIEPDTEPDSEPVSASGVEAPFLIYLSGSDTRSKVLTRSRSDVNILAVVNPQTKQILLLNTPRDYYVSNPAGGGAKDKLTHCGLYGVDCSMEALSNLYGEKISYYAQINFTGFETLIDAVGGVDVYSEISFYSTGCSFSKGINHLNGAEALVFARERYSFAGGDNARGKNQMKIITAVIEKMCSGTTLISNYTQILDSLEGMFATNVTPDEISTLVKMQLSDMASWNVLSYAVSGTGGSSTNYSMPKGVYSYVMYPDQAAVDFAADLIDRIVAGEILTSDDLTMK